MDKLITVYPTRRENFDEVVSARELHEKLGIGSDFSTWIKAQLKDGAFEEGRDYFKFEKVVKPANFQPHSNMELKNSPKTKLANLTATRIEYALTIDTAKHIALMARNEKGKEIRRFFIEREKELQQKEREERKEQHAIPRTFAEALRLAADQQEKIDKQAATIEKIEPTYAAFLSSEGRHTISEAAKALGMGRNTLFQMLRDEEILMANNLPYQNHIDAGRFEVRFVPVTINDHVETKTQTLLTVKGLEWIRSLCTRKSIANSLTILNSQH
jgi:anti-repressor protein